MLRLSHPQPVSVDAEEAVEAAVKLHSPGLAVEVEVGAVNSVENIKGSYRLQYYWLL